MQNFYFVSHGDKGKPSYPANIYLFKFNIKHYRKMWNMFKGNNENTRTTSMRLFSTVSIVYFEQVNVSWVNTLLVHIMA